MRQIEELKIFLASPSDVAKERSYVMEVIDEINRTIAPSKGVFLRVTSSDHTFPGYGQDGQSVLNKQIGTMKEYDIFLGIMWSRVGTPTQRAESGTIEEFKRAARANTRYKKPEIWFYFRQLVAQLDTPEKLEQAQKVVKFKKKIQSRALTHDYKKPSNFRDLFRQNLSTWLNARSNKTSRPRIAAANPNQKPSKALTNSQSPTTKVNSQIKSSSTSTAKKGSRANSRSTTFRTTSISNSGAWVMLNNNFFLTESVDTQANQTVIVHISPANSEQEATLRNLQPDQYYKKPISYAYQNEAGMMQVESILLNSIKGKTLFILTLSPEQGSQRGNMIEIGYSADQIAELRARLLLLNETPNIENNKDFSMIHSFVEGFDNRVSIKKGIFLDLWTRLKTKPHIFLHHARLAAVYHLKMSHTVEHILELKLSITKNNIISIQFRGQRKSFSVNQETAVIQFKGTCPLK